MSHSLPATASALKYVVQCTAAFAELCRYGTAELDADNDDIAYYFHSHREPNVALTDYMRRVEAETRCGEDAFYITLILIGRACNDRRSPKVLLPSVLTAHRLFLTGLRVATKMHHDLHRSNRTFAKLGGITNREMNQLEFLFLDKIGFNASVLPEELERVKSAVHLASGLGTSQTIARLLANAMGLEVSTRLRRPKSEFAFKEATLPPVTDTVSGGGRAAVRTLRAGRMSASGSMNSSSGAFTSATPLRFPPTGDLQLSTSSLLLASQSLVSPDASP